MAMLVIDNTYQGWPANGASLLSLQEAMDKNHVFIHQAKRTVATLLSAW